MDTWAPAPVVTTDDEARSIDGYRWWTADELRATDERYYPDVLADLVHRLASC